MLGCDQERWNCLKRILLSVTLRHFFRIQELIRLLNRLRHCKIKNHAADLEVTLTQKIQVASSLLTPQIVCGLSNLILYSENEPIPSPRVNIISYDCLPDVYVRGKNLVYIAKSTHR